ncbi:MAG: hypothetical protein AB7K36_28400, partial [Chloroflexota bacterium]
MMHSDGALPTGPVSLARRRPWIIGGMVVLLVLLTPIAWYLLSPLFIDQHAQEEPSVAAAARAGA